MAVLGIDDTNKGAATDDGDNNGTFSKSLCVRHNAKHLTSVFSQSSHCERDTFTNSFLWMKKWTHRDLFFSYNVKSGGRKSRPGQ